MITYRRLCKNCGCAFETPHPLTYFCSTYCRVEDSTKDKVFSKDVERVKYNEEHNTHYSYGTYFHLKKAGLLSPETDAAHRENHNTNYWINVPAKVNLK